MKILEQVNWCYTLYEDDNGSYVVSVVVPARNAAWAVYEKEYRLSACERFLVRIFPSKVNKIAKRVLRKEKKLQSSSSKV